jgi:hypothetical protein
VHLDRLTLGRRWPAAAAAVGVGLGYALLASFTRPFTWGADVATAVPLVLAVVVTARTTSGAGRRSKERRPAVGENQVVLQRARAGIVWVVPVLAVTGWELYCYGNLPRATHPTLSSLIDMLDATRTGKIVAFASWLVLGWFLVTA